MTGAGAVLENKGPATSQREDRGNGQDRRLTKEVTLTRRRLLWSASKCSETKRRGHRLDTQERELIFCSYLPSGNPFSRLGPGALTDRETKTPQPRCSAPPPAPLKGPAATRPSSDLHHLTGLFNDLKGLPLPPRSHASSWTYKNGPSRQSKHLHQTSMTSKAV